MTNQRGSRPAGTRHADPGRRDRIIEATLEVIASEGVDGTSMRRVAAAAGVPLGSMTYHFSGREELLTQAFARFAGRAAHRFDARLRRERAGDRAGGARAVVDLVLRGVHRTPSDLLLAQELYSLAAREPGFRLITEAWMARSRAALEHCFDSRTAALLDALIEGLTLHRALGATELTRDAVIEAVARLVDLPLPRSTTASPTSDPTSPRRGVGSLLSRATRR